MNQRIPWIVVGMLLLYGSLFAAEAADQRISIYPANPAYWQYKGQAVLLVGGSKDDSLFQIPDIKAHLDLLASVGGNYVRNTMSSRMDHDFEVQAFRRLDNGQYDLDQWNDEYWQRFARFLKLTHERDIIVQIEVWATFDYYRENWAAHPMNPKNNINYTVKTSGLPVTVDSHPTQTKNNFFRSIPAVNNQAVVLQYQQRFVDKMLSYSLPYGHVLYCMDNETSVTPEWGWYWSRYIRDKARASGVTVCTTEMWDAWDLANPMHNATFDHPEIYAFVDISQNNHQKGQAHWDNAQKQRARIAAKRRPLNCVKIYGADTGRFGNDRDALERFWRNVFGGLASARFHRPDSGLGLNDKAQASLLSMRLLTREIDVFASEPHNDLLTDRQSNEAYCFAQPGHTYAVFFPNGGAVGLNVQVADKPKSVRWLNILTHTWQDGATPVTGSAITLNAPSKDYWMALVK
ncbi:MAG: hypothetical protein K9N55_18310 [Phycisphaerae bacterium]|nr:hypothetical protein [Phycisphaerae bacterium]